MLRWLPEDVSPYGASIDSLFYFIYYITAAAFILVTALMIIFLYQYRHQEGRRATYSHGNTGLEILWTIIPALIFIGLGFASKAAWDKIKVSIPPTDTVIKVTGKQFNWEVLYPGPDGEFETDDDYQVDNDVHIPAGKPVRVVMSSKDVIHSVFIPNLRFKQDTVPGREIVGWFQANKPGKYEMPCAELCGFGHSGMRGWVYALAPDEYQAWYNKQWPQAASQNGAAQKAKETSTQEVGPASATTAAVDEPRSAVTTPEPATQETTTAPAESTGAPTGAEQAPHEATSETAAASEASTPAPSPPASSALETATDAPSEPAPEEKMSNTASSGKEPVAASSPDTTQDPATGQDTAQETPDSAPQDTNTGATAEQ